MIEAVFKDKKCNFYELKKYGFKLKNSVYQFITPILDNQFKLFVETNEEGCVETHLIDSQTNEEYFLHKNENLTGAFISKIREEYDKVIIDIEKKCFSFEAFKTLQTKEIISYIKEKYDDELEFLWEQYPDCAIARRKDNKKWYLIIMTVKKDRLGIKSEEIAEIMNLTAPKEDVIKIVDNKTFFPAYHMNKKTWFTVLIERVEAKEMIFDLIDGSYQKVKGR